MSKQRNLPEMSKTKNASESSRGRMQNTMKFRNKHIVNPPTVESKVIIVSCGSLGEVTSTTPEVANCPLSPFETGV